MKENHLVDAVTKETAHRLRTFKGILVAQDHKLCLISLIMKMQNGKWVKRKSSKRNLLKTIFVNGTSYINFQDVKI